MTNETAKEPLYLGHRQRLRTRFLKDGGVSMADYELLELILTYAILRRDVKDKAKELLSHFKSLSNVLSASQKQLTEFGLTQNTIALFKVILNTSQRLTAARLKNANEVMYRNIEYVIDYCKTAIAEADVEEFHIIMFDNKLHMIKDALIQRGSIDSVPVYIREVVKEILQHKTSSVILYHNHPSGGCQPSDADVKITNVYAL